MVKIYSSRASCLCGDRPLSKRHQIVQHMASLNEIRAIMNSMKTLSMLEARKLTQTMSEQERVVSSTEQLALDFIHFYSPELQADSDKAFCLLVIGTERGFCGNFNDQLIDVLNEIETRQDIRVEAIIAVGRKLCMHLKNNEKVLAELDGASVTEEAANVIQQVVDIFRRLQSKKKGISLKVVYFQHDKECIETLSLLPPFEGLEQDSKNEFFPPVLNLEPDDFFSELVEQYLLFRLHEVFYSSLKLESQQRVKHLESAIERLDQKLVHLARANNMLRQEEITEEIEIILLNAASTKFGAGYTKTK